MVAAAPVLPPSLMRHSADALQAMAARGGLRSFTRRMFPEYRTARHIHLLTDALEWAVSTPDARLIVTMPPRHSKSLHVSEHLPAWFLGNHPDKRVIAASHTAQLAYTFSRRVRNKMGDPRWPFPGVAVADDKGAVQAWDVAGHRGGYYAVGVGGSPTGHGGDCLSGDTLVMTYNGCVPIARLVQTGGTVLGFDHETERPVWRPIEAARVVRPKALYELVTESGRRLRGTGDHRVFVEGRGYRAIRELRRGDILVGVRPLRSDVHAVEIRDSEGGSAGQRVPVLFEAVRIDPSQRTRADGVLSDLQRSGSEVQKSPVFAGVRPDRVGAQAVGTDARLSPMRDGVPAQDAEGGLLLTNMRGCGALGADASRWELQLQGRNQLRQMVSRDASIDFGTRPFSLRGVRQDGAVRSDEAIRPTGPSVESRHPSHRSRSHSEWPGESHCALPKVSPAAPRIERDAVAVVRRLCGNGEPVYDIQVAGCRNFFAEGVLVHNCIVIDDPIRSAADADSETIRAALIEWYQGTLRTRLEPGGFIVITATRWHESDLTGWLLEQAGAGGEQWEHLHLPALSDDGAALWPERWPVAALERIRSAVGSRAFEAQYQGRPSPAEGGTFKRDWWRFYDDRPALSAFDRIIQSWDMTFRETKAGSYVVGQVWGAMGADRYLLDQYRERTDFPGSVEAMRRMSAAWPQSREKLVEDKANGPAVVATLRSEIPGLIEVSPEGGKEARANAISHLVEAGNVWLPRRADWLDGFVEEAAAFPNGKNDDQVDAMSQALVRWNSRTPPAFAPIAMTKTPTFGARPS